MKYLFQAKINLYFTHGVAYTVLLGDQVFHQSLDDALVVTTVWHVVVVYVWPLDSQSPTAPTS